MNRHTALYWTLALAGVISGCEQEKAAPKPETAQAGGAPGGGEQTGFAGQPPERAAETSQKPAASFVPPDESEIPNNEYGETVRQGKALFVNTQQYAKKYVGNAMNCSNCHLDNGRRADSAPLWAAYVLYPAYRKKTGTVDTIQTRIQGCFMYSMNGRPPALDSKEMTALVTYHYWMSKGAPTGVKLPGQGFIKVPKPAQTPDVTRGEAVYKANCMICHGANGEGIKVDGRHAFPPLWGKESFNWGAGMHRIDTAAGFIKANMPYGHGGTLTDQEAWDVALFMNSHERPQDPRFKTSLAHTRDTFHDENCLYGRSPEELTASLAKKGPAPGSQTGEGQTRPAAAQPEGYSPAQSH